VLGAADAAGMPRAQMLCLAGLSEAALDDAEARVPQPAYARLWDEIERRATDPFFGLHFAEGQVGAATFSVVGFAAKSSRTLGEALERVARYSRLLNDTEEITLAREGRALVVGQNPRGAAPQWSRHKAEGAIANYVVLGRKWTGQPWSPLAVSFRHEAPGDVSEHRRIFQCPVRFGRERNELRLDLAVLDLPLDDAAPDLGEYLRRRADRLLALSSPKALLDDVRLAVREGLPSGHPDVATLARRLGTSTRSLQRRLAEEGTTYATLVDEVRRDAALELLADRHVTVEEAAFLLGFADARGFRRAFERWTGQPLRGHRGAGGVRSA
jgi:AraC-like DNA-binding protein